MPSRMVAISAESSSVKYPELGQERVWRTSKGDVGVTSSNAVGRVNVFVIAIRYAGQRK